MKTQKFQIIRLSGKSMKFETGATIDVLTGWHATTLHSALRLCELAKLAHGGEWVPAINAEVVTVFLGWQASDVAPSIPGGMRKALPRKVGRKAA